MHPLLQTLSTLPKLKLAQTPTPLIKIKNTTHGTNKNIWFWRDDLTGCLESGNKIRKLEYLMADALKKGCDHVITCGGHQSNHTRATTVMARRLGLGVSLITRKPAIETKPNAGNLLLNEIFQAHIITVEPEALEQTQGLFDPFLVKEFERLKKHGKKPYIIPLGGSNALGAMGYIHAIAELKSDLQPLNFEPTDLFCALGSAGTFVGIQAGLHLHEMKTQLHGVNVIGPIEKSNYFRNSVITDFKTNWGYDVPPDQAYVIDGYVGGGYSITQDSDLKVQLNFARNEGILLDPCYTGKAYIGMIAELKKRPHDFGDDILFLHTGGAWGASSYADQYASVIKTLQT